MAITTQLVGKLGGGEGYHFIPSSGRTYQLPPNSSGWSISVARTSGTAAIDFTITNRTTGEIVKGRSTFPSGSVVEVTRINGQSFNNAARDGMNLTFANANVVVSIASGGGTPPLV